MAFGAVVCEAENFTVEYDQEKAMYRVSWFEDCHFQDEAIFDAYEPTPHSHWTAIHSHITPKLIFGYTCPLCNVSQTHATNYCPTCGAKMDEVE